MEEKITKEKRINNELAMSKEKIKRDFEQLQTNYNSSIKKTNFFRNSVNKAIDKDQQILNSIHKLKTKYQTITDVFFQLKEVNRKSF